MTHFSQGACACNDTISPLSPPLALRAWPTRPPSLHHSGRRMFVRHVLPRLRAPAAAAAAAACASAWYGTSYIAGAENAPSVGLDPAAWRPLKLEKVTPVSANTAVYRFAYADPKATSGMTVASCLLTKAAIGSEKPDGSRAAVIRPYTPTTRPEVAGYLDLVVKSYPEGKMSKHIGSLKVGDTLDFKGPIVKKAYTPNECSTIGMVAGGTGITPMLQVIDEVLANPKDKTKLQLVFANQSEADILLKKEIDDRAAAHPSRLSVYYVVDKSSSWMWKGGTGYVTEAMLKEHMPAPSSDSMIFVCGPPPMYKAICGPKGTPEDPKAQGELGGLLKKMGYETPRVFKF